MIEIKKKYELRGLNTLKIRCKADYFCEVFSTEDCIEALSFASDNKIPFLVIGGGTNIVFSQNFKGLVVKNTIMHRSIIENNVHILDGAIIGKKGFGFIPNNIKNLRYPHIGYVHIKKNSEIGSGSTIDRGSLSLTVIGENSYLDNQVHIAHNVKIGNNCIIAAQVGIAGSSTLGNNVMIGGQAGISGHLKIGNNVQIGGGSGVVKDISDNSKVMGYPARDFRKFLRENKSK